MSLLDKILKNYTTLAKVPALLSAEITFNGTILSSIWTQRDIEKGKNTKILRTHILTPEWKRAQNPFCVDITGQLLTCLSNSENLIGLIREHDAKQFLEIWSRDQLKTTVDLKSLDVHGDVYTDGEFASLQFSPDETKLLYVAEKKIPKTEPFYKRKQSTPESKEDTTKGQEYLYREDWGEQLVNKVQSVVVQYDLIKDEVEILSGIPENVCPAKPTYSPNGSHIVGIAYRMDPRKLGLIYCTNRLSTVFKLDFEGNYMEINLKNKSVKEPRYTPDGNTLIWLQRNAGGPHAACMSLVKTAAPITETSEVDIVIDLVQTSITTTNSKPFYGLFNTGFPKKCWANDRRLLLSTNQKNTIQSYIIDIDKKTITQLKTVPDSFIVLGIFNDVIVANHRNFLRADILVTGKLGISDETELIEWIEITSKNQTPGLENYVFHYVDLIQDTGDVKNFSAIYIGPETGAEASVPLIVWPHGGPHSAFANNFSLEASLFLKLGYALLLINFRGSIGAGQASVDYLLGRVGISDVSDCILATETVLSKYPWLNKNSIALVGGSHGGFLVTHLSGQKPDMFKVVVARNPVIDIASMSIISDIPDWCYVEAGSEYTQIGEPDINILKTMRLQSPIQHAYKVKAPTLLQIGSKDLRVPQHQSKEYYNRLKANGVIVKMNVYDDNHPLGGVLNEVDNLINTLLFIEEHIKGST